MANFAPRILAILITAIMVGAVLPAFLTTVEAANPGARDDDDKGYLAERWHLGLGSGIGELSGMIIDDIDDDNKVEIVLGNSQGYLHVLEYDDTVGDNGGFVETWQSVKMGSGAVRGMTAANIDDDPYLEIAVGFLYQGAESGRIRIIDGKTLEDEDAWRAGVGLVPIAASIEAMPYSLQFADVSSNDGMELIVGSDTGHFYVLNATDPNDPWDQQAGSKEYEVSEDTGEGLWIKNTADDTPEGKDENLFGLAVGNFDSDANYEIMTTTKARHLLIYDSVTQELEYNDTSKTEIGLSPYGGLAADLDGDGQDEYIVGDDKDLKVYYDQGTSLGIAKPVGQQIRQAKGLAAHDLYGSDDLEILVMTDGGQIYILDYSPSGLTIDQTWDSGERFRAEGGHLGVAELPGGKTWLVHGGDSGVLRAWDVTQTSHEQMWSTHPLEAPDGGPYSIPNGTAHGVVLGDIDDDGNEELIVGSQEGRVFAFDGQTKTLDWHSPILDGPAVGLEIADVDGDSEPDLLVGTGNPLISREADNETATYGQIHIFHGWNDGTDDFDNHWTSGDNASIWGIAVGELDGSQYPEIALAAAQTYSTGGETPQPFWKGWLRIYGFNGTGFEQEFTTDDEEFNSLSLGIAVGDADNDGTNEAVIGVTNNSHDHKGRIYGYEYDSGDGNYTQIFNLATTNHKPFAIEIANLDDSADGTYEIIAGDSENPAAGSDKSRVSWYRLEGSGTPARKGYKEFTSAVAWGLWVGDVNDDGETEFVVGQSNGNVRIYKDIRGEDNSEPYANLEPTYLYSLSPNVGFYGGIDQGNLLGGNELEMVFGSSSYVWVFSFVGGGDRPDLEIREEDLEVTWEPGTAGDPTEDDNVNFYFVLYNVGALKIDEWKISITYGNDQRITGLSVSDEDLNPGEEVHYNFTWESQPRKRLPTGDLELTIEVSDPSPKTSGSRELNEDNNLLEFPLTVTAIPNDAPVAMAEKDKDEVWINEAVTLDAGASYDNEDTGGSADDSDGDTDLWYKFYPRWQVDQYKPTWTSWTQNPVQTFWFPTPGTKQMKVLVHDERYKESEEVAFEVEVITNSPPTAHLTTNLSDNAVISHGDFITLDASGSADPDGRYELEYKFAADDSQSSDSWISNWGKNDAQITFSRGDGKTFQDDQGSILKFTITNGGISFNYTLSAGIDEQIFRPQVAIREVIPGGDPLSAPVVWTELGNVSISVSRPPNTAPVAVAKASGEDDVLTAGTLSVKATETVTFVADEIYDPDGDKLSFVWNLQNLERVGGPGNGQLIWSFQDPGTYTVTLTVTDGRGGQDVSSITVKVGKAPDTDPDDETEILGMPLPIVIGAAGLVLVLAIAGATVFRTRAGGEEGDFDYGEGGAGVTMLTCPTCGSTIEVATPQRPIRVACGGCAAEFILRE